MTHLAIAMTTIVLGTVSIALGVLYRRQRDCKQTDG